MAVRTAHHTVDAVREIRPGGAVRATPRVAIGVAIGAAYLLITLAVTWPLALYFGSALLGRDVAIGGIPSGDQNCFLWAFWWFGQALFDANLDLFHTSLLAHPGGLSLMTTPITPLYAALSVPLQRWLTLIELFNLFTVFSLWATAVFTYLFARAIGASRPVAFLCGCLFGFTTYHLAHAGHLNLLCTQWLPMTLWAVWRGLATRRMGWAALAALGVAAAAYSEWYLSVFLAVLLFAVGLSRGIGALTGSAAWDERRLRPWFWGAVAVCAVAPNLVDLYAVYWPVAIFVLFALYGVVVLAMLIRSHPRRREQLRNLLVFCAVTAALIAPFYLRLFKETRAERTVEQAPLMGKLLLSAEVWNYVAPPALIAAIEKRAVNHSAPYYRAPTDAEFDVFPGYVVWALCGFVCWRLRWRRTRAKYWLAIAAVFAVLSLGVGLRWFGEPVDGSRVFDVWLLPGVAFHYLPLLGGLRVFARFGIVVQLALAAWLAVNLDAALWGGPPLPSTPSVPDRRAALKRWLVGIALAAAMLLERFHGPRPLSAIREADEYRRLAVELKPGTVLLGLPLEEAPAMMYCQTRHGLPLVNYFGARVSAATRERFEGSTLYALLALRADPGRALAAPTAVNAVRANEELRRLGVEAVLLHRALCRGGMEAALDGLVTGALGWREATTTAEYIVYLKPAQ